MKLGAQSDIFPDLVSLSTEYLNSAPKRAENTINSIQDLIQIIKEVESKIQKLTSNIKIHEN